MKTEVINIKTISIDVNLNNDFTVTLSFWGKRVNSKTDNRSVVNITFSWYFLRFFKYQFQKLSAQMQARLDDAGFNKGTE